MTFASFLASLNPFQMLFITALMVADVLFGGLRALKAGNFRLQSLGDIFKDKALPIGLAIIIFKVFAAAAGGDTYATWLNTTFNIIWGVGLAALFGSITENLSFIAGVPIKLPVASPHKVAPTN